MATNNQQELGLKAHRKGLFAMSLASLASFQYGVDFGIIGGLQAMIPFLQVFGVKDPSTAIGYNIPHDRQQLIASLMILGAFVASMAAGFTSRYVGRKMSLWIACFGVFVSTVIMQATTSIGALYAGRLIIGLANGMLMTHAQLYIQEILPGKYRGLGISAFSWWVTVGSFVGTIVDNYTASIPSRNAYIVPLGIVHVVPGILFIGLFFIPESPRWLASLGKMDEAEKSLLWLRPKTWSVSEELAEMETALAAEALIQSSVGFLDLFKNPIDRRRTVVSVLVLTTQAASGAMFIISYGTYFFQMANVGDAFQNSVILNAVGVFALLLNSFLVTRIGYRRVMMMNGLGLCGLSQLIIAIVYTVQPGTATTGKVVVGISVIYIVAYNGMISSYAWVSGGELSSQRLRSYTFGMATAIGFFGAWLTTFTAPYFINPDSLNWGPRYGYIWAPSCWIAMTWVYFYLPEVKDRSLEEIDEMFEARLPARKFRGYRCTGTHTVLEKSHEKPEASHDEGKATVPAITEKVDQDHAVE
ncbi:putative maltose permease [Pseudomassariella vexata]|uniref:Putative maltose permease n=1 Tax=Pseudomassariella vexata TaxID=1141098 RepID=A0A1Y2EI95_9PEZI|nr:putative maltose permease [Pseudomassariella vexata]ORY70515.1 putative maltose permease [Pseudomassariella vexata]